MGAHSAGRLVLALARRVLAGGAIVVPAGPAAGLRLGPRLPLTHVQGHGLVRGTLEPGVQEALRRHVGRGAVVFDVGANLGFFALLAGRLTGPSGRVVAFEPLPESAAVAREHARLNRLEQVVVHECAVGDRSGSARSCASTSGAGRISRTAGRIPGPSRS